MLFKNPFDFFDAIYCINLDRRTDRWELVQKEFAKVGILHSVIRFSAIESPEGGAAGCMLSHRAIIQIAKDAHLENILIFEDDVIFLQTDIDDIGSVMPPQWGLLYLGAYFDPWSKIKQISKLYKISDVSTTHAVAYHASIFDDILKKTQLWRRGMAIDRILAKMQSSYGAFMLPQGIICSQRPGHSDINKGYSDYADHIEGGFQKSLQINTSQIKIFFNVIYHKYIVYIILFHGWIRARSITLLLVRKHILGVSGFSDKILISYADENFSISQKHMHASARLFGGIRKHILYSPSDIDRDFFIANKTILSQKRGGGYWLWKPYIVLKTLQDQSIPDGTVIIYSDAGTRFLGDIDTHSLVSFLHTKQDIYGFYMGEDLVERRWTKRDLFQALDIDRGYIADSCQYLSGLIFILKSELSRQFFYEFLDIAQKCHLIDDSKSRALNFPDFIEHRHDQSIFSLLYKKYHFNGFSESVLAGMCRFSRIRDRSRFYMYRMWTFFLVRRMCSYFLKMLVRIKKTLYGFLCLTLRK